MPKTYIDTAREVISEADFGTPIYTKAIAEKICETFGLSPAAAAAAAAVAVKRIMDAHSLPDLRCYQKGIYYRVISTPFGETGINKEQLIADKYLSPDQGYETGLSFMHHLGLTTQLPRQRVLATNHANGCARMDKRLDVLIRPPKTVVTASNKYYLQTLDVLESIKKAPIDAENPYQILAKHIQQQGLHYDQLLALADQYYSRETVLQIAHTAAGKGGLQ